MGVMQKILGQFDENNFEILLDGKQFIYSSEFEKIKKTRWTELRKRIQGEKGKLWNGPVYRLSKITQSKKKPCLHLSLIDYKAHYATPWASTLFTNRPFKDRPNGIFTSAYLLTSDNKLIFGKRQTRGVVTTAELSLIGGNLSPDDYKISSAKDIYGSFYKELKEETNIGKEFVKQISGLGIYISDTQRVGIFLICKLLPSQKELQKIIILNEEHKELIFLTNQKVKKNLDNPKIHPNIKGTFNDYLNFTPSKID